MTKLYIARVPLRLAVEAENMREARAILLRLWEDCAEVLPEGASFSEDRVTKVDHLSVNTVSA